MPDPVPEDVQNALRSSARRRGPFGEPLLYFLTAGSTNDIAASLAEAGAPQGATVMAAAQTAGRGRLGREWFSPPGAGLYVSVVCRSQRATPLLTLAGGVAVARGIRRATGLPVTIKWPNDVVIADRLAPAGRRKLAGVLAEGSNGPDGLQYVVVGFGINLNRASYPPLIADRVTSVEMELGRPAEAGAVLSELLIALNEEITGLETGDTGAVLAHWRELAPSSVGTPVEWSGNGTIDRGTTAGIDDQGALLVRVAGRVERIIAGEVKWL